MTLPQGGAADNRGDSNFWQEQPDAGGEAVNKILLADWSQFPLGEEAGHGNRPQRLRDGRGVVMWLRKHPRATAIARKEQCSSRGRAVILRPAQELLELGVGSFLIADMKLHGLAGSDVVANRDRAA